MKQPFEFALKEYGEKEILGDSNNSRILQFSKEIGAGWVSNDETPWCAIFIQWCLKQAGRKYSYMANAAFFLEYSLPTETPQLGDIIVLNKENDKKKVGHVGFFIKNDRTGIYVLGGNQNNSVNITKFEYSRFMSYRKITT